MGLDSTVVYPTVDLKLRNPYDFPIVMHYQVNQGSVKVELLGKERPNKVIFEREIKTETPFPTEEREDPEMPEGQRLTLQEGYPGYLLVRRRYVFPKDQVPKWYGTQPLAELLRNEIDLAKDRKDVARVARISLKILGVLEKQRRADDALDVCRAALEWAPEDTALLQTLLRLSEASGDPVQIADALEALLKVEQGATASQLGRRLASLRE